MSPPRPLQPSLRALLQVVLLFTLLVNGPEMIGGDADLATHIAYGRVLWTSGFPSADPLLYGVAEAQHTVLQEWGFEVVVAALDALTALQGPLVLGLLLTALAVGQVHGGLRRQGVGVWVALIGALLAFLGARVHLTTRPHLVSWLLCVPWWLLLEDVRRGRSLRSAAAPAAGLFVLWANTHGGFLLGLGLLATTATGEALESLRGRASWQATGRLAGLGVVAAAATLVNPWGPALHAHLAAFLSNASLLRGTLDFGPPNLADGSLLLLGVLALVHGVALLGRWRTVDLAHWLTWLALLGSAAGSLRQLPYLALVGTVLAFPYLARWLDEAPWAEGLRASNARLEEADPPGRGSLLTPLAAVLLLPVLLAWPVAWNPRTVPVGALRYVDEHPELASQRPYTGFLAGGFLVYATAVPQVFVHPLNANYPPSVLSDYLTVDQARTGWQALLQSKGATWSFQMADRPIVPVMTADPCWEVLYDDGVAAIHRQVCAAPGP